MIYILNDLHSMLSLRFLLLGCDWLCLTHCFLHFGLRLTSSSFGLFFLFRFFHLFALLLRFFLLLGFLLLGQEGVFRCRVFNQESLSVGQEIVDLWQILNVFIPSEEIVVLKFLLVSHL